MEISPTELKRRLDEGDAPVLLDVREPHELMIAAIEHNIHIPLGQIPQRLEEISGFKEKEIVVICRTGARSDRCASFLRAQGFEHVLNLTGGIHAWSDEVDPAVMKY